jgi:hypothetical protein
MWRNFVVFGSRDMGINEIRRNKKNKENKKKFVQAFLNGLS